jgi:hypothetical protein
MADPLVPGKKAARTFDFQAMMEQARSGAQERSNVDWDSEIEKTKEENEIRISEMKLKANEAAKQMHISTNDKTNAEDDDDDDDFGPSINLASASTADDGESSSEDESTTQPEVCSIHLIILYEDPKKLIRIKFNKYLFFIFSQLIKMMIVSMMMNVHFFL